MSSGWIRRGSGFAIDIGGMRKYGLTDVVQEEFRGSLGALDRSEDGHGEMFERRVHLAMGPTERVDHRSPVLVGKLFKGHAG